MIKPKCYFCKKELSKFGAILLSPPTHDGKMDSKEIKEAIPIITQLYDIRMGQCGFLPAYETSIEAKALQTLIQTAEEYLNLKERVEVEKFHICVKCYGEKFYVFSWTER